MARGDKGTPSTGGKCGCAVAVIVGVPLIAMTMLIDALGDCAAGTTCRRGADWISLAVVLAVAALLGLGTWAMVNWVVSRSKLER
jgi:hypothetical protein